MSDEPWRRRKDESPRAYAAFRTYRELNPRERTAEEAARVTGEGLGTVRKWCTKYEWVDRAVAWDDTRHAIEDDARLDKLRKMHEEHLRLGRVAQLKAMQALQNLRPDQIPAGAAIRLLELGIRIETSLLKTTPEEMLGIVPDPEQEDPFDAIGRMLAATG